MPLSHFDSRGASKMVNVGEKEISHRLARASGLVTLQPETLRLIRDQGLAKGNVFEVARLAGIMAAKQTDQLIPLCHSLSLDGVSVTFHIQDESTLRVEAEVTSVGKTGVEMEALVAVSIATLTLYDMCKAVDRGMVIGPVQLEEKSGGKSGHFQRQPADAPDDRNDE